MNAQVAQHLNIAESAIVRIEEWASVLFVVCKKLGARFVSKKVVKKMSPEEAFEKLAEDVRQKFGRGELMSDSISLYPLGMIDLSKKDGSIFTGNCSDTEVAVWAERRWKEFEIEVPASKVKPRVAKDYFYGAADEESF